MKKLLTIAAVLVLTLAFSAAPSKADTLTLTASQIGTFVWNSAASSAGNTSGGCDGIVPFTGCSAQFTTGGGLYTSAAAVFSVTGVSISFGGADSFALGITNTNFSTWDWTIQVHVLNSSTSATATLLYVGFPFGSVLNLSSGQSGILSIAMATAAASGYDTITGVDIAVNGPVPNFNNTGCPPSPTSPACADTSPDFHITSVPEPGTLALFGAALLGLAGLRRKLS